jgi:hypothetical protein
LVFCFTHWRVEGVAEFTSGISKGYFGKLSDEKGVRLPFIKPDIFLVRSANR